MILQTLLNQMQLQRSLFSFYKVFIRKTPLCIWIGLATIIFVIMMWQIGQFNNKQPPHDFQQCLMQIYNATRQAKNDTLSDKEQGQSGQGIEQAKEKKDQGMEDETPYFLRSQYHKFLNKTSTIRVYLSDEVSYQQGQPSCRIILNVQKIKLKLQKAKAQQQINQQTQQKVINMLQEIIENQQVNIGQQDQQTKQKQPKEVQQVQPKLQRPSNVRNYDQISQQEKKFYLNTHPFIHLTADNHIVFLDQDNSFHEKHNIKIHAVVLSRQSIMAFPQTIFGINSKLWRFHTSQDIQRNQITLQSLVQGFQKVQGIIREYYYEQLQNVNMLISLKIMTDKINEKAKSEQNQKLSVPQIAAQPKEQELVVIQGERIVQQTEKNKHLEVHQNNKNQKVSILPLPSHLIPFQEVYPLSDLKIYYHYPQALRNQDISKLILISQTNNGIFFTLFFTLFVVCQSLIMSALIGLLVRYLFFWIVTIYLFLGGCFINKQWGWVFKYFNLVRNRVNIQNNISLLSSCKMLILFAFALVGIMTIFTFGSKYVIESIYIHSMTFSETFYSLMILKNFFLIQLFYYICCRTRLALKYFPLISLQISILTAFFSLKYYFHDITWFINLHMLTHLFVMCIFSAFQNLIGHSTFHSQFNPSMEKPRALYYIGYDISWQNTLPPIWTYFTTYFDLKHFDQKQRALIDRDYQLLYGRLMGMNDRQELPEDEQGQNQEQVHKLDQNLNQSNQMGLIR